MSATIITFPAKATCPTPPNVGRERTHAVSAIGAVSIATKFTDHFLPVVQAKHGSA